MKKLFFIALIFAVQPTFAQRNETLDCGGLVEESKERIKER